MRTLNQIKQEIDSLSDRRIEVMRALSQGFDATLKAEHQELEEQIAQLWEEQRNARAMLRFGDRDVIIQRARQEERLSPAALAQLGERRLCKAEVIGSIPIRSINHHLSLARRVTEPRTALLHESSE